MFIVNTFVQKLFLLFLWFLANIFPLQIENKKVKVRDRDVGRIHVHCSPWNTVALVMSNLADGVHPGDISSLASSLAGLGKKYPFLTEFL